MQTVDKIGLSEKSTTNQETDPKPQGSSSSRGALSEAKTGLSEKGINQRTDPKPPESSSSRGIFSKAVENGHQGSGASAVHQRDEQRTNSHASWSFRQILIATNVALSYVNVGASIAWAAPLLYDIKKYGIHGVKLDEVEGIVIGSLLYITASVTPIPTGMLSDMIGRKLTLISAGVVSCVSWLLVVFFDDKIKRLYISRAFGGLWTGVVLTILPLYVSEIARPNIRGTLGTISPVMLMLGSALTFILGPNVELRVMAITCSVMPHIFLLLMLFLPESPHWLIHSNRLDQAKENFEWLRGMKLSSNAKLREEFEMMVKSTEEDYPYWRKFKNLWQDPVDRRAMLIVQFLTACQRFSGVSSMLAYATITIPDRNVGALRPKDCITVIGSVCLVSTLGTVVLLNKVGRIPLLVVSSVGAFLGQASLATWFYVHRVELSRRNPSIFGAHWFPFFVYLWYGVFYVIGIGSVPSVFQGEMFTPKNKNYASGMTVIVMSTTSFFVSSMYFVVAGTIGWHWNFGFYAVSCMATLLFTLTYVPETKGKTLAEIRQELASTEY